MDDVTMKIKLRQLIGFALILQLKEAGPRTEYAEKIEKDLGVLSDEIGELQKEQDNARC